MGLFCRALHIVIVEATVERFYARSDLMDRRGEVMQAWAIHVVGGRYCLSRQITHECSSIQTSR